MISLWHYRVLKQALRASGANVTSNHVEELSLGTMFLLEAAKKADKQFHVTHTSAHSTRDAHNGIYKIAKHLTDKAVTVVTPERQAPAFVDLTDKGWKKIGSGWLECVLQKTLEEDLPEESDKGEDRGVTLDYELSDVN